MVNITFIWHDCFTVETESAIMVFDFWKDPIAAEGVLPSFLKDASKSKPLYVFVSHHHKDHFNKNIFSWEKEFPEIRYIISNDTARFCRHMFSPSGIYAGYKPSSENVSILKRGEIFSDGTVTVEAFGSTDIGNSYWIECCGQSFFHAGDLNAWIWADESTVEEINKALGDYCAIIKEIKQRHPVIDFVMFPVDSRIGSRYFTGAKVFLKEIRVSYFFPMHFCLGETEAERSKYRMDASKTWKYANTGNGCIITLQSPFSSLYLS